ncbi:MAG: hypothetical protein AAGA37_19705 [Actinomycetota bacterium]
MPLAGLGRTGSPIGVGVKAAPKLVIPIVGDYHIVGRVFGIARSTHGTLVIDRSTHGRIRLDRLMTGLAAIERATTGRTAPERGTTGRAH